jgi:hypothetical protein
LRGIFGGGDGEGLDLAAEAEEGLDLIFTGLGGDAWRMRVSRVCEERDPYWALVSISDYATSKPESGSLVQQIETDSRVCTSAFLPSTWTVVAMMRSKVCCSLCLLVVVWWSSVRLKIAEKRWVSFEV